MDILDIVNKYIEKKQEISTETLMTKLKNGVSEEELMKEYNITKEELATKLVEAGYPKGSPEVKSTPEANSLTIDSLYNIVSKMYNEQVSLTYIADRYKLSEETLIKELKANNFRNRWTIVGNILPTYVSHKAMHYLHQLNIERKNIEDIAINEGQSVSHIEEELKRANFREIWVLEGVTTAVYAIPTIKDDKVILDLKTGELNALYANGRSLFSLKQVVSTLGINGKLIYDKYNDEFIKNVHFNKPEVYLGNENEFFKACPHINYLRKETLFTERGLHLFASLTKTTNLYHKKILELENLLLLAKQKKDEEKLNQKEVKVTGISNSNETTKEETTSSNNGNPLDADVIVQKLNSGEGLTVIAKKHSVQASMINKVIRDAGYQFNSFFRCWTNKSEVILIEDSIREVNKGITLYDYSNKFVKTGRERLHFADQLRRKIEKLGYNFDQKTKKWVWKRKATSTNNKVENLIKVEPKTPSGKVDDLKKESVNSKENRNLGKKVGPSITSKEIIEKLHNGSTLKEIEEESGVAANQLRIQLKADGYKYDSFFKTYINKNRAIFLKSIAEDILEKRATVDKIASRYSLTKVELEEQLLAFGYDIYEKEQESETVTKSNIVQKEETVFETNTEIGESTKSEKEKFPAELVKEIDTLKTVDKNEPILEAGLTTEDVKLLREVLQDKKKDKDEIRTGKKAVKIYLSDKVSEEMEEYTEKNDITKSSLISKALEFYFKSIDEDSVQQANSGDQSLKSHEEPKDIFQADLKKDTEAHLNNTPSNLFPSDWDKSKQELLFNAILEGTRKGRTLGSIVEDVGKEIGVPASKCQSYWYAHGPKHYKDEFKQIKLEQEKNWTGEDVKMLEYIINVEFGHLSTYESIPIASQRLERHIEAIRKKWFETLRNAGK